MRDFSYGDLHALTNRFANVLRELGLGKDDLVACLTGRIPELYVAALGTLKNRSVFSPPEWARVLSPERRDDLDRRFASATSPAGQSVPRSIEA